MKKKNHPLHGHGYGGANLDNVQIITLKEVDSTNNFLRSLAADEVKNEIVVAVAKNQTAGRGQRGNSWESEAGKNLTFIFFQHQMSIRLYATDTGFKLLTTRYAELMKTYPTE